MGSFSRLLLPLVLSVFWCDPPLSFAESQSAGQLPDLQIYEKFRAWATMQPTGVQQDELPARYRANLVGEGLSQAEIEYHIRVITERGQQLEIERWNRILTAPTATFNVKPNAFLIEMIRQVRPGRALDVGMGQGRNAIYLAERGWDVTGFDPAEKAVAAAQQKAAQLGVKLTTRVLRNDQFDFGRNEWDLIVFSYVGPRRVLPHLYEALRPGGLVIVEGFHRDATKTASISGSVVFETNELLRLFSRFRVVRYEDTEDVSDFGLQRTRLVRLCVQKPG